MLMKDDGALEKKIMNLYKKYLWFIYIIIKKHEFFNCTKFYISNKIIN
jgi:hypothetical protein